MPELNPSITPEAITKIVANTFYKLRWNNYLGGSAANDRDQIQNNLSQALIGNYVRIEELPESRERGVRPIERCNRVIETPLTQANRYERSGRRHYEGCYDEFLPQDFFRYARISQGRLVGIDFERDSLVVRPRGIGCILNHHWVRVIDTAGQPLVKFSRFDS